MRLSVVVSTYNREPSLCHTLAGLRRQTHGDFEVVVVNGPSTDGTAALLAQTPDIRAATCPVTNLSRSRNIGIAAAAGEVVAFIDDDAIPEATWLEGLDAAYDDPAVVGAGGLVFDHTGAALQYRYSACDRTGTGHFDLHRPLDRHLLPGADPFIYLQGTNMSFRRSALVDIGGFDDDIEYMYDEVDVCLQLIDGGGHLRPLDGAAVHHKYLASHLRNQRRMALRPFLLLRNRAYFALQYGRATRSTTEVVAGLLAHGEEMKRFAREALDRGELTEAEVGRITAEVDAGLEAGMARGMTGTRVRTPLPEAPVSEFRRLRTVAPAGGRHSVCLLSQEFPPQDSGGVGRYTADLAAELAAEGHEVHVLTRSLDTTRVDLEDGVWMHRVAHRERPIPELAGHPMAWNLGLVAAQYREVAALHERVPVDLVLAPLWLCEGAVCQLDDRFTTVLTLVTSHRTIAGLLRSWEGDPQVAGMIALERATLAAAEHVQGISAAVIETAREEHGVRLAEAVVVPLGVRDRAAGRVPPAASAARLDLLFVGRLERRKGIDVLLAAAPELLERFPALHLTVAGRDTPNTDLDITYREDFARRHAGSPALRARVTFTGEVDAAELDRLYAAADVVCAPSRYESFGLVLVEAMMFGRPVVACAAGGMGEVVEDGGNGLLAVAGDAASLADRLTVVLADAGLRQRMGRRSRELFEQRFTAPRMAAGVLAAFAPEAAAAAPREPDAGPPERVRAGLARLLTDVAGLADAAAAGAADQLLRPHGEADDLLLALRRLWITPDADFVAGAHRLLTGGPPASAPRAEALARLAAGLSRADLVRDLAQTGPARQHLGALRWLDRLEGVADEVLLLRLHSIWPAPAADFLAAVRAHVAGKAATRWEWWEGIGALAAGTERLSIVRAAVGVAADRAAAGWLPVLAARAGAAAADPRAARLRSALVGSPEDLVDAIYGLVLVRAPDPPGRRAMLDRLAGGIPAGRLISEAALSDEVLARELDTSFLLGVAGEAPPSSQRWKRLVGRAGRTLEPRLRPPAARLRARWRWRGGRLSSAR